MERKYQRKLFDIEVDFEHKLNSAKQFRDLSNQLRKKFDNKKIVVSEKASIKKKSKIEWRIIDESNRDIEVYRLKWNYDDYTERKWIDVYGDTPSGKSDIIWDYHAFSPKIDVREVFGGQLFNGENRKKLTTETQKQKWDFFFRPIESKIGEYQRKRLEKVQEKFNRAKKEFIIAVIVLVVLSVLFLGLWQYRSDPMVILIIVSLMILGLLLNRKWLSRVDMPELLSTMRRKKKWIRAYSDEIDNLEYQIDEIVVPHSLKILKWLEEEIIELSIGAQITLSIDQGTALKALPNFNPLNLDGISIFNHAIFQPNFKGTIFDRLGKQAQNFYGYWTYKGGYIQSGWYMEFIFLTHEKVCTSTLYYDFIRGQTVYQSDKQYYYKDLIGNSVVTRRVDDPFHNKENKTVKMDIIKTSFKDSQVIAISLKNIKTSENIRNRIKQQKSMHESETHSSIEDNEKLIADILLSDTNSYDNAEFMIKHIRRELYRVKIKSNEDKIKLSQ